MICSRVFSSISEGLRRFGGAGAGLLQRFNALPVRHSLWLIVLSLVLPACIAVVWFLQSSLEQLRASARSRVQVLANATANELDRGLARVQAALAQADRERPAPGPDDCRWSSDMFERFPALMLVGRTVEGLEQVCARSGGSVAGFADIREDVRRAAASSKTPTYLDYRVSSSRHWRYLLALHGAAPVGSSTPAIAWGALSLDAVASRRLSPLDAGVDAWILDQDRRVVRRLNRGGGGFSVDDDGSGPPQRWPGNAERGADGAARIMATARLAHGGWQVAASMPEADVLAEHSRIVVRSLIVSIVLVVLALGSTWQFSHILTGPIRRLEHAVALLERGRDDATVPEVGPFEIRRLAQHFNRMVEVRTVAEAKLRGILETAVDAIVTVDEQLNIVQANPAAAKMFGHGMDQMSGMALDALIPARHRQQHRLDVEAWGRAGSPPRRMAPQRDVTALRADGSEFPVEAAISQTIARGQRLYTAILRDVTERVRSAKALEASESLLRRLLMSLPEAVLLVDDGRVSYVNTQGRLLVGSADAGPLGEPVLELFHARSRPLLARRMQAFDEGTLLQPVGDLKLLRRDGAEREVQVVGTRVLHDGQLSILMMLRDMTEIHVAERELERSHDDLQRLIAAMEEVQEEERRRIARELHDDLQQTLAAIRMEVDLLQTGASDGSVQFDAARRIDELAAEAISSTRRMLSDLRPQPLEDMALPQALGVLARNLRQRHGIECHCLFDARAEAGPAQPRLATCLFRVAQEALNNVVKHAGARRVYIELHRTEADWRLVVRDDGRGLRSNEPRDPQSFGLLGMRERVHAAGGTLRVQGSEGKGTTIEVVLPDPA